MFAFNERVSLHSLLYLDVLGFSFCVAAYVENNRLIPSRYRSVDSWEHVYNALQDDIEDDIEKSLCHIQ